MKIRSIPEWIVNGIKILINTYCFLYDFKKKSLHLFFKNNTNYMKNVFFLIKIILYIINFELKLKIRF